MVQVLTLATKLRVLEEELSNLQDKVSDAVMVKDVNRLISCDILPNCCN